MSNVVKLGRTTKEHMISELRSLFKENDSAIIAKFQKINVNRFQQLKKTSKLPLIKFKVVKNSMVRIAVKNAGMEFLNRLFEGTCAVLFCNSEEFLAASKTFINFSKENETFKVCGGVLAGESVDYDKIKQLAMLPSKEVLLGTAIGRIKSPISGFVGVLNNLSGSFVRVLDQIINKKS